VRRLAPACCAVALISGCGLGTGGTTAGVQLTVTQGFGAQSVAESATPKITGSDTVIRLLERNAAVTTRYGGGFVESIDGLAGGQANGHPVDWFYYVNGLEASRGAAATVLHRGDHVWWDRHDWSAAMQVPAVVGSFPEPFLDGSNGQRLPVRIECTTPSMPACGAVSHALTGLGIPAARGGLLLSEYNDSYRVIVGPWSQVRTDPAAQKIELGPRVSGVFARFDPAGHTLSLLDKDGRVVRVAATAAGLVAATKLGDQPPVWVVTGTDTAAVTAAARAFDAGTLHNHFAVAVVNDVGIPLPAP
jgi:hypothetical protein